MSLVNDMLNDLDKRRHQSSPNVAKLEWLAGQRNADASSGRKWLLVIILLVLVILALVLAKLYKPVDTPVAVKSVVNVSADQTPDSVAVIDYQTILSVIFSRQDVATTVFFEYSGDINYKVTREPSGLQIIFFDAQQKIDTEMLNFITPIKSIATQNQSNIALVSLGIEGEFKYSEQKLPGQGLELLINTLAKKPSAVEQQPGTKTASAISLSRERVASNSTNQLKKTLPVNLKQQDRQVAKNARRLIDSNQLAEAEQVLQLMLQKQPLALHSGELLVTMLLAEQRIEESAILLTRLRDEFPAHIGLIEIQARLFLYKNDVAAAVDLLMTARPSVEIEPAYYELLGLAARQNQQYLLSEQAYKGLLNVDAGQGDWWVGLAIALDAQGELLKARNAYQQALKTARVSPALEAYAKQRLAN